MTIVGCDFHPGWQQVVVVLHLDDLVAQLKTPAEPLDGRLAGASGVQDPLESLVQQLDVARRALKSTISSSRKARFVAARRMLESIIARCARVKARQGSQPLAKRRAILQAA